MAERRSSIADADVERQRDAYADALVTSYQLAPGLTALGAMVQSDGIETVIDQTTTMRTAEDALDGNYDEFRAASTLADVATDQAQEAKAEALALQVEAREARDRARAAADAAAARRGHRRREGRPDRGARPTRRTSASGSPSAGSPPSRSGPPRRPQRPPRRSRRQPRTRPARTRPPRSNPGSRVARAPHRSPRTTQRPARPALDPRPTPTPSPPPPSGGAQAAIAFARAQLGEPYRWGAAGPGAWDCSGLTMGAWRAGGKYLPHYSVAQYEQSTPISAGSLRPGDLVFWGSSSSPSSIYHVALYVGGGQIIHAPRTGRPVTQESMYYWIPPNFYARPVTHCTGTRGCAGTGSVWPWPPTPFARCRAGEQRHTPSPRSTSRR